MEENVKKADGTTLASNKLSYEQLEQVAAQLQGRLIETEKQLRALDMAAIRLSWLFRVVEHKEAYSEVFVKNTVSEIEKMLTIESVEGSEKTEGN